MPCLAARRGLPWLALALAATLPLFPQQPPDNFRWVNFHSSKDQNIVVWVTRSLAIEKWTAIRDIGVEYDAALVVTSDRPTPQSAPSTDTFSVWSVSLTSHIVAPLLTGAHLRWFDWERFADGAQPELPVLYDNCAACAPSTYFTSFHYDLRTHTWTTRWMTGGHGVPVWNAKPPSGLDWSQVYAVMAAGGGHMEMCTWNHFDYGKSKPSEDFLYAYDQDPFSGLGRSVELTGKDADAMKFRLCHGQDAIQGLERGQDSPLCQQYIHAQFQRQPVTTPPANNQGRSVPPGHVPIGPR